MLRILKLYLLCSIPLLPFVLPAHAQISSDEAGQLRKQIEQLQEGQRRIENTLNVLSNMLASRKVLTDSDSLAIGGYPGLGDGTAKVVLVEFSDYECLFCGEYYAHTFPRINDSYIQTGKIRYVARNFPLERTHPYAKMAAEAAYCAGEQGKYWDFHDKLFTNQKHLAVSELKEYAVSAGIASEPFDSCLQSNRFAASVERDIEEGRKSGVGATPTFLLGYVDPKDPTRIKVEKTIKGSLSFQEFQSSIDSLLAEPSHRDAISEQSVSPGKPDKTAF
ncbi:protein-disulfide isomerase [Granulicella aggregans]|uniref:Protein-disulfide isomerase n=1 Tax=Granulicella aggregans TaxID=474949 RepID=A0A7W7ZJR1_9BACT|nr:DsbA family protein [Granulicella aggregans]MBB5061191.1 protein-disulfide isomerase [Granulicella aggregans]